MILHTDRRQKLLLIIALVLSLSTLLGTPGARAEGEAQAQGLETGAAPEDEARSGGPGRRERRRERRQERREDRREDRREARQERREDRREARQERREERREDRRERRQERRAQH